MAYVYRHIRIDKNVPFYIGIGSEMYDRNQIYKRAFEKARRSVLWKRIAAKGYEVEILFDNIEWDAAKIKEIEFISLYGRIDLGTGTLANMTDGGDGTLNKIFNDEYRAKLSKAARGRKNTEQAILNMKAAAAKRKGVKLPEEWRKKVAAALIGRRVSDSAKQKISNSNSGVGNGMYGIYGDKHPNFKGRVYAYKGDELVGEYNGLLECATSLNITKTKISACLNGRRNTTGGYTFKRPTP
jgi:hypothetical protein